MTKVKIIYLELVALTSQISVTDGSITAQTKKLFYYIYIRNFAKLIHLYYSGVEYDMTLIKNE